MVCREPGVSGAKTFGMETLRAFGSAYWFGSQSDVEGPWVAPLFTAAILTYLSVLVYLGGRKKPGKPSLLRNLVTAYALITGLVEITRFIWDVSRYALVYAALHNLAEWGIIGFTAFKTKEADKHWWRSQLWILTVSQWILFAPTLTESGLGEQIAGLTCDWLLVIVWSRLYIAADPTSKKKEYIKYGLIAAGSHMLEILALIALLVGLVPVPWVPGCIIISYSTPITFYFYYQMVEAWDASGDEDLVSYSETNGSGQATVKPHVLPNKTFAKFIAISAILAVVTLIGPVVLIPPCPPKDMKVPPGAVLPPATPALPGLSYYTGTPDGHLVDGQAPPSAYPFAPNYNGSHGYVGSNESLCASRTRLTGTTTVVAKPGKGALVRDMIATMPGPVRQEDGNLYFELAFGGADDTTIKVFESWSSIRSLYKHMYTSPHVARVFFGEAYRNLMASQLLEGPFQALIPCSVAERDAQPVVLPINFVIDAPVECVWARMDDWKNDYSWVQGALGVTALTAKLRTLHFKSFDLTEIRQTAPLPEPEQPEDGHRLVYYVLSGGVVDTLGEVYIGDLSIVPSKADPSQTVVIYTATLVAKDPSRTTAYYNTVRDGFYQNRVPYLQSWGRTVADSSACKALLSKSKSTFAKKSGASTAAA